MKAPVCKGCSAYWRCTTSLYPQAIKNAANDAFPFAKPIYDVATSDEVRDIAIIAGGISLIVVSGGGATPFVTGFMIVSGSMATAGGTAKLALHLADRDEDAQEVPTSYSAATVGMLVEYTLEGKVESKYIEVAQESIDFTEGFLTLKFSGIPQTAEGLALTGFVLYKDVEDIYDAGNSDQCDMCENPVYTTADSPDWFGPSLNLDSEQ